MKTPESTPAVPTETKPAPKPERKGLNPWLAFGLLAGGAFLLIRSARAANPVWRKVDFGKDRFLLIGDSLAEGLGVPLTDPNANVAGRVVSKRGARISAYVGNGNMVADLQRTLAEFQPTVVLVSLGTNDEAARLRDPYADIKKATEANVAALLKSLANYNVIWIGPPQLPWENDTLFRQMLRQAVGPENYFASHLSHPVNNARIRANDGIHFTAKGYKDWLDAVGEWIKEQNERYA